MLLYQVIEVRRSELMREPSDWPDGIYSCYARMTRFAYYMYRCISAFKAEGKKVSCDLNLAHLRSMSYYTTKFMSLREREIFDSNSFEEEPHFTGAMHNAKRQSAV
uniref:Uncharacterized protein n=1 Tax=Trichogramma kaykai TaxID=54128 RepID=A0ABD2XFM7_9HYME